MPIRFWIEADKKRVRAVVTGEVTDKEIVEALDHIAADPEFKSGFDVLSDHMNITKAITTEQVKLTSAHIDELSKRLSGIRWAVVTKSDASYGMMRMLSTFLEPARISLNVFRSMDQAEEWLAGPR